MSINENSFGLHFYPRKKQSRLLNILILKQGNFDTDRCLFCSTYGRLFLAVNVDITTELMFATYDSPEVQYPSVNFLTIGVCRKIEYKCFMTEQFSLPHGFIKQSISLAAFLYSSDNQFQMPLCKFISSTVR